MGFFEKKEAANPDDARVSEEELSALGISKGITMTRGELNAHLETLRRKSAYGETLGNEKADEPQGVGQNTRESGK